MEYNRRCSTTERSIFHSFNRISNRLTTHTNTEEESPMLYYLSYVIGMLRILAAEYEPEEGEE